MPARHVDPASDEEYLPLADYGVVGNLWTAALVGRNGSVDWCCLPELSSPSVFAGILDRRRGGRFRVGPAQPLRGEQAYSLGTNVLRTKFSTAEGRFEVIDFMPVQGPLDGGRVSKADYALHRLIRCREGRPEVRLEWAPRFEYGSVPTEIRRVGAGAVASAGASAAGLGITRPALELRETKEGPVVGAAFRLSPGEEVAVVMSWGDEFRPPELLETLAALRETKKAWRAWKHRCAGEECVFGGRHHEQVVRSGLLLKLLTHPETGAIAAAPTTSLPEAIGGNRNWDYRYAWIRDASFTAQALTALGHEAEAGGFLLWAKTVSAAKAGTVRRLQILYGLHGEAELPESELPHLEGYRSSRPVRVGNAAVYQHQLDVYGELLGAAYEYLRIGGRITPELWEFLAWIADETARRWREADHGIWEVRGAPRHYVSSKVMAWMGLDRALQLSHRTGFSGDVSAWSAARDEIRREVLSHGYDRELGSFVQSFGSKDLDASTLLIPLVGFLPFDDPRVRGTVGAILRDLTSEGLVYRYRCDDGLEGDEGTFLLATYWMVDALALSGRAAEAAELFDGIARRANHLGLFPEEVAPSGEFLGNFPQAFSHIGFINSALYLALAEGKAPSTPSPVGCRAHREETGHEPGAAA